MVLSAIGILMVVDHHTFTALNLFGDYIPYNSFFMPMFVFISGYFNRVDRNTKLLPYIGKKIKNLLLPYLGLSVFVFLIEQLINFYKAGEPFSLPGWYLQYMLERIVTIGSFGSIVEPMWFVIALFSTLLVYAVFKKLLCRIWNSYVMLVLFCGMNVLVVYLAQNTDPEALSPYLVPLKVLFFLPFLEFGIIYRDHLEKKHEALPVGGKIAILALMLGINAIRTMYLPSSYDVAFDSIDDLSGFTSPYLVTPLVSSIIGILFWLTLTDLIEKPVSGSRFVNYMSCNTFWIMGLHILFFNILNCILLAIDENIVGLLYFDTEFFRESEWYYWEISPDFKLIYVVFGILGPLFIKRIWDMICLLIRKPFAKKQPSDGDRSEA